MHDTRVVLQIVCTRLRSLYRFLLRERLRGERDSTFSASLLKCGDDRASFLEVTDELLRAFVGTRILQP